MDNINYIPIQSKVSVRKYSVNIKALQDTLRTSKTTCKLSCKDIADKLNVPLNTVEHWFRTDKYFTIPEPEIWYKVKELLNITTTEFDESILTFELKDNVFEKADRLYQISEIAPTVSTSEPINIVQSIGIKMNESDIKAITNYLPSGHNTSKVVDTSSISLTVMENHGTITGIAIPLSLSDGVIEESEIAHCLSANGPAKEGIHTHQAMNRVGVTIPIMNPSFVNKSQNDRTIKEDGEEMYTLTKGDIHGVIMDVEQIGRRLDTDRDNPQRNRVYNPEGLSPCLNASMGEGGNQQPQIPVKIDSDMPSVIGGVGEMRSNDGSQYFQQDRVYDGSKVATSLTSNLPGGANMYSIPVETTFCNMSSNEVSENTSHTSHTLNANDPRKVFGAKQERTMAMVTIADPNDTKDHPDIYVQLSEDLTVYAIWYEKYNCYITIRKLTPKETWRLQGFPDWLFERAEFVNSDSQLYKQSGNSITTNIAYEIGKKLAEIE